MKKPYDLNNRRASRSGVDDAARTRDLLNHNQGLYQLSYIHHATDHQMLRATEGYYTRSCEQASSVRRWHVRSYNGIGAPVST